MMLILIITVHLFICTTLIKEMTAKSIFMKLPDVKINDTEIKMKIHLNDENIKIICKNSDVICKSNNTNVCGMRFVENNTEFQEFENSCYMFLKNMCIYAGEEFFIVSSGTCKQYKARRRTDIQKQMNATDNFDIKNITEDYKRTDKPQIRSGDTFSPLYDLDTAYDYHVCPHSCPDIYKPECVSANRGTGKYFKFFTFINHCVGDMYYCKHYEEFAPPEDGSEDVKSSPLGWSYCGASRYVQFAGFAEAASSMGHYGWLAGNYRYSHIMEPNQRIPGHGKK